MVGSVRRPESMTGISFSTANSLPTFTAGTTEDRNVFSISSELENCFSQHYERSVFNQIVQNAGESIDEFANRIRWQAAKCGFREQIYDLVRLDRFIAGLIDRNLRNTLLMEKNITFEDAYSLSKILTKNDDLDTAAPAHHNDEDASTQLTSGPFVSVSPTCPTEDQVVSSLYPNLSPLKDASFYAVSHTPPPPAPPMTNSESKPAVGTYVALKSDLKHTRGNPPIWRMADCGLLEKFIPFVEGRVIGYKSSALFSSMSVMVEEMFEKVEVENETKEIDASGKWITVVHLKSRTEFAVGAYIVLKSDLKSKKKPPIWRVAGGSILQKFVPNPNGEVYCYRSNKFFTCTDWTWRLSDEDFCEVAVVKEKVEDAGGYEVSAIRLKDDALRLAKAEMDKEANSEAEFVVGAYVVLKDDVGMSSIWRILGPDVLQKFTRRANENGSAEYVCVDGTVEVMGTNSRWRSSKQEFYKVVDVTDETTEVDLLGRKVMTVWLKEDDTFQLRENHCDEVNKSDLGGNASSSGSTKFRSRRSIFKVRKFKNKKMKKSRKRKIRHAVFCGLMSMVICCCV